MTDVNGYVAMLILVLTISIMAAYFMSMIINNPNSTITYREISDEVRKDRFNNIGKTVEKCIVSGRTFIAIYNNELGNKSYRIYNCNRDSVCKVDGTQWVQMLTNIEDRVPEKYIKYIQSRYIESGIYDDFEALKITKYAIVSREQLESIQNNELVKADKSVVTFRALKDKQVAIRELLFTKGNKETIEIDSRKLEV